MVYCCKKRLHSDFPTETLVASAVLSPKRTCKVIFPKESPSNLCRLVHYLSREIFMRARVNHFTGTKLHLLHLNCCFSIFMILFSFGFGLWSTVGFLLHTDKCMHIYRVRNETFCFSHGDCVMHRVTQLGSILK